MWQALSPDGRIRDRAPRPGTVFWPESFVPSASRAGTEPGAFDPGRARWPVRPDAGPSARATIRGFIPSEPPESPVRAAERDRAPRSDPGGSARRPPRWRSMESIHERGRGARRREPGRTKGSPHRRAAARKVPVPVVPAAHRDRGFRRRGDGVVRGCTRHERESSEAPSCSDGMVACREPAAGRSKPQGPTVVAADPGRVPGRDHEASIVPSRPWKHRV